MNELRTEDERLYPAKVIAGFASLVVMMGFFFLTLSRGYHDVYTVVVGAVVVGLAAALGMALYRRHRRRLGLRGRRAPAPPSR